MSLATSSVPFRYVSALFRSCIVRSVCLTWRFTTSLFRSHLHYFRRIVVPTLDPLVPKNTHLLRLGFNPYLCVICQISAKMSKQDHQTRLTFLARGLYPLKCVIRQFGFWDSYRIRGLYPLKYGTADLNPKHTELALCVRVGFTVQVPMPLCQMRDWRMPQPQCVSLCVLECFTATPIARWNGIVHSPCQTVPQRCKLLKIKDLQFWHTNYFL